MTGHGGPKDCLKGRGACSGSAPLGPPRAALGRRLAAGPSGPLPGAAPRPRRGPSESPGRPSGGAPRRETEAHLQRRSGGRLVAAGAEPGRRNGELRTCAGGKKQGRPRREAREEDAAGQKHTRCRAALPFSPCHPRRARGSLHRGPRDSPGLARDGSRTGQDQPRTHPERSRRRRRRRRRRRHRRRRCRRPSSSLPTPRRPKSPTPKKPPRGHERAPKRHSYDCATPRPCHITELLRGFPKRGGG